MLAWHKACVEWACYHDAELPGWARDIKARDATPGDAMRLRRECDARTLFGTGTGELRGILDFVKSPAPAKPFSMYNEAEVNDFMDRVKLWSRASFRQYRVLFGDD